MAQRFAAEGARVLAADINEAGAQETVAGLDDALRERAMAVSLDVTNEAAVAAAIVDVLNRWGRLDVFIANAGIGAPAPIARLALGDWERVLAVNLTGVFLCAKHAFAAMQQSGGVILATASVAGMAGTPGLGAYGPSKAGVIQLMETVALEGARFGIRANAICPVWTQTPMVDAFVAGARSSPEEAKARMAAGIPLGRLGRPEDIAAAAVFLASDEAAFITGVAFPVDGGMMAGRG
jgi:NAD(P)-dependent dehydrogenase (short-subunit alcohol dehydrogenase family)